MIKREELNSSSSIAQLLVYLESNIDDKFPRDKIDDYEQGKYAGRLVLLDIIKSICK